MFCVEGGEHSAKPLLPPRAPSPAWGGRCSGLGSPPPVLFSEGCCDLVSLTPAELWVSHLESGNFPLEKCPCHRT